MVVAALAVPDIPIAALAPQNVAGTHMVAEPGAFDYTFYLNVLAALLRHDCFGRPDHWRCRITIILTA